MPAAQEIHTYCRLCGGICGLRATVEGNRVVSVRGDRGNPLSRGYICSKGRQNPEIHHGEGRLRSCLARGGPRSVALFHGTQCYFSALNLPIALEWFQELGGPCRFGTMTIDQSAKWTAPLRQGSFASGPQSFQGSDVWLLCGANPLVSRLGPPLTGFPIYHPDKSLEEAQRAGLRLIVVDPRRSETAPGARHA